MARDFSALNKHAHREYKFVQADSYRQVRQTYGTDMDGGACMGVVLNWVKEKLSTSNGLLRPDGPLRNSAVKHFSNPLNPLSRIRNGISPPTDSTLGKLIGKEPGQPRGRKSGARNEAAMLEGAKNQENYNRYKTIDELVAELELDPGGYTPEEKTRKVKYVAQNAGTSRPQESFGAERVDDATIAGAGEQLPKGNAIVLDLKQEAGGTGHAVAFYKSRGGTLYFFDPNAGVYEISRPYEKHLLGFVQAWLDVYTKDKDDNGVPTPKNWKTKDEHRWYSVYTRTAPKKAGTTPTED
ncbi:YopT-type cysteine protease domain-containing protein [Paraburkholderia sp. CNPSo 3076]|uniref:YopT-type cysteine protease domain-containing protein n=1 Tax=Paraburkholderia sp. CNPSo 3076 TaxID=2940936 RepID=UPI00225BAC47|nr:YopT-type cysteine protease domain-containing protein [Paraburkholderia sp. CNPSo 3076]MCX5544301.1 YopT-type cysteine protease domain-containing protein [Paraburkholderia sp. CNPSo 3076]